MRHEISKPAGKQKWILRKPPVYGIFKLFLYVIFALALLAGSSSETTTIKPETAGHAGGVHRPARDLAVEPESERAAPQKFAHRQPQGVLQKTVELARNSITLPFRAASRFAATLKQRRDERAALTR